MMKKIFLILLLMFTCQSAQADLILLKNGQTVEGKIVQVRGIFVRVVDNYDSPFREFLIEDIVNIEQSSPDEVSQLTIRNIHQRALNRAQSVKIQEAVDRRAVVLLEEAIQRSEAVTLDRSSNEVKAVAQQKATAIIDEAVRSADTPRLDEISAGSRSIAEEKAGILIEEAVKTVKFTPLNVAPQKVQEAAKEVATVLVGEAEVKKTTFQLGTKDQVIGGLIIVLLALLLREKRRHRKGDIPESDQVLTSSLREIDEELKKLDQNLEKGEASESENNEDLWDEKRDHRRAQWNFPISMQFDEHSPIFAMVKNISLSGAYAVCGDVGQVRALGERLQSTFSFTSKDPNFPINGKAQVVRIRSNRGLGLKFFDLEQASKVYLHSLS